MPKISITRGDSRTINITYLDSTGAPLDLTGSTVFFTVNASQTPADDTLAAISKTVTSFAAPTTGVATITLTNSDTQSVAPGTYYYDAQVKDALGNVTTSKVDEFIVVGDITRRTV